MVRSLEDVGVRVSRRALCADSGVVLNSVGQEGVDSLFCDFRAIWNCRHRVRPVPRWGRASLRGCFSCCPARVCFSCCPARGCLRCCHSLSLGLALGWSLRLNFLRLGLVVSTFPVLPFLARFLPPLTLAPLGGVLLQVMRLCLQQGSACRVQSKGFFEIVVPSKAAFFFDHYGQRIWGSDSSRVG